MNPDWQRLARLRSRFLQGNAGDSDYWESQEDVAQYDATYAQRIGWKWEYVLGEMVRRGWRPPQGPWVDWGCGSGIAHRVLLDLFPEHRPSKVHLHDRSAVAMAYAERKLRQRFPGLEVDTRCPEDLGRVGSATVLLSHVLTELDEEAQRHLVEWVEQAEVVIWVEPGTHAASRALIRIRELLAKTFRVLAPCTHANPCPLLKEGNENHWCHQFATVPTEVFMDSDWGRFAQETGIDLRSLPVSYLVLDRRSGREREGGSVPELQGENGGCVARLIGRPRVYKAHAQLMLCHAADAADYMLQKRVLPDIFKLAKKEKLDGLFELEQQEGQLVSFREREWESSES